MATTVNRVRKDESFGRYYGQLRVWEGVSRTDLQWQDSRHSHSVDEFTSRGEYEANKLNSRNAARAAEYY